MRIEDDPLLPSSRYPPSHDHEAEEKLAQEVPDTGIFSAYHRETIFRGTNLESPVPTLELRIPGLDTPLPSGFSQSSANKADSCPVSPADSAPFSDYISYESKQVDVRQNIKDCVATNSSSDTGVQETPRMINNDATLRRLQQPQTRIVTDLQWQSPQSPRMRIPSRSPLDELCHSMQTPSDLPTSPSPFSPKPPRSIPSSAHPRQEPLPPPLRQPPTVAYPRGEYAREGWELSGIPTINRPQSTGATMPNYSLPSFKPPGEASQEKAGAREPPLGVRERWIDRYRRSAPMLSCILAIVLAVGLTICGRGTKTGICRIAKISSAGFVSLGSGVTHVEMFPSGLCLMDGSNSRRCEGYGSLSLQDSEGEWKLTEDSLLLVDVGLTMSAIFSIFLALYLVITVLLSSMLLNTLRLPVCYFTTDKLSTTYREKLDQVYTQASEEDLIAIFWLWWGHHHAPLNIIFLLATFSSVSMSMIKLAAILSRFHGDVTAGPGLVIPAVCLFLYLTWILEVGAFLANPVGLNHAQPRHVSTHVNATVFCKFALFGNLCYKPKLREEEDGRKVARSDPSIDLLSANAPSTVTAQSASRFPRQSPFHQFSFGKKSASLARTANSNTQSVASDGSSFVVYERPETEFSAYRPESTIMEGSVRSRITIASPVQYRSAVTPQSINFLTTPQSTKAI